MVILKLSNDRTFDTDTWIMILKDWSEINTGILEEYENNKETNENNIKRLTKLLKKKKRREKLLKNKIFNILKDLSGN